MNGEAAAVDTGKPRPSARRALIGLSLSMFMASLDTSIANSGLPTLARAFGATFQQVQWIVLAYLLAVTSLIVSVGRLGDMIGRGRLLLGGIALFTVSSLACGAASTLWILVAARAAQGLGAAVMMALSIAFVSETVPREKIGVSMGLLGTMSAIGTALGPSLGGLLTSAIGWRAIFLVNVPVGIVALALLRRYLPGGSAASAVAGRLDLAGTGLLAATLSAYAFAMTAGRGTFGPLNLALLGLALCGAILFVLIESKVEDPILEMSIFRDLVHSGSLVMSLLVSTVIMSTLVVGPFYLAGALHLDAARVGLLLSVGPSVVVLAGVPAGKLADRYGAMRLVPFGLVAMQTGCMLLSILPSRLGVVGYVGPIVILTAGYAVFQTANTTVVMSGAAPEKRGVLSGTLSLSRNLGLVTGASVMGAVFAFASGSSDMELARTEAVASGMRSTFAVGAALIGVALLASWASRKACQRTSILRDARCAPIGEQAEPIPG